MPVSLPLKTNHQQQTNSHHSIWTLFLISGFRSSFYLVLVPYVTSEWQAHSLMTTIPIVSSAMTAACYIPMAKALDVWGRAEGFLLMSGFATLGLILMAVSQNLATFCAAQVFYSVGFGGMIYAVGVLAADASNLRNRGLAFAFTSSPYMITAFAGSKAAAAFVTDVENWRWGFGWIALVLPCVTIPLFLVLKINLRKAFKNGTVTKTTRSRGFFGSIWWAFNEFDGKSLDYSPVTYLEY
jgi:MFS family permease